MKRNPERSTTSVHSIVAGWSLLSFAFVSCDRKDSAQQNTPTLDEPSSSATVSTAPVLSAARWEDRPENEGWDSEAFHNATNTLLKKIGKTIADPASPNTESIGKLLAKGFACTDLRPDKLETVYQDPTREFSVARTASGIEPRPQYSHQGSEGLSNAFLALATPFEPSAQRVVMIKNIEVSLSDQEATTTAWVRISAHGETRSVQQLAHWRCHWSGSTSAPSLQRIELLDFEETTSEKGTLFSDATRTVIGANECFQTQIAGGIPYWLRELDAGVFTDLFGHNGLAIGDVNGDGLEDIYLCQPGGLPNRLFLQNPDGSATDAAGRLGVDWLDVSHSALFLDLDNDGDQDLAVGLSNQLVVLSNEGKDDGFTKRWSTPLGNRPRSLTAGDVDSDGDLDLYVCIYSANADEPGQQQGNRGRPDSFYDARNGGRNSLWRNRLDPTSGEGTATWNWSFDDVTSDWGLNANNSRWSLAAAWEDYDDDGDLDLCVANDFGANNLYRNVAARGAEPNFEDVAAVTGTEDRAFGMSVSWGDYDRDGAMDMHISNMWSSAGSRITSQEKFRASRDEEVNTRLEYLARGNTLLRNRPTDGSFEDLTIHSGIERGLWAWGSQFGDINNDGWEDLLVANGFLTNNRPDDL